MRVPAFPCVIVLLVCGANPVRSAEFTLFKSVWGDAIVATDATPAGKSLTPPTRAQPVYYRGLSLGDKLGSIPGDRQPDVKQLNAFVAKILAQQGYLGAQAGVNEPSLFLVLQWGYIIPGTEDLLWFLGYNPANDIAAPVFPGMLGPEVWRRGMRTREIDTILENASNPIYGILITAFDYKSARTTEPIAYWQTRIGLPSNGKSMAEALPTMLVAAGPAIGRPSDKPVFVDADSARSGSVTLGELKFLDYDKKVPPGSHRQTRRHGEIGAGSGQDVHP
ncbi:MAG TPA: hypothetical protein VIM71_11755 [Lacunisphaera sp.]